MESFAKRNLIFLVSTIELFAVSLVSPLFTQHFKSIGFSNTDVGIANSAYSGIQFLASPLLGHFSDIHGSKQVLVTSLLICALCYPLLGLSLSFGAVVCVQMMLGLVKHTQLLCKNYIQEHENEDHIKNFGKLSGYTSLGYIIGPIIGGYVVNIEHGYFYMCCLTGLFFAINSIFAHQLKRSRKLKMKGEAARPNFIASLRNIPWSLCWDVFLLHSFFVFAIYSFYFNYNLYLAQHYNVSSVVIGYSISFQESVRSVTGFQIRNILRLFPPRSGSLFKIQITYAVLICSLVALYFSSNFKIYLFFLIPFNVCLCFLRVINLESLVERTKDYNKGIILGAFNNVTAICRFILPLVAGYAMDRFGDNSVYVISVISLFLGILLISFRGRQLRAGVEKCNTAV